MANFYDGSIIYDSSAGYDDPNTQVDTTSVPLELSQPAPQVAAGVNVIVDSDQGGLVLSLLAPQVSTGVNILPAAKRLEIISGANYFKVTTIKFTGDPVPKEHLEDALLLDADAYIDLFQIVLSDQATQIYLKMNSGVTWQGQDYEGTGCKIENVGSYADDQTARPQLTVFNPEGIYSYLVDQGLLEGGKVVRYRVLKTHIDNDLPIYRRQQWRISRVASLRKGLIVLELRDMLDGQVFMTPARMFIPPDFPTVSLAG